MKSNPSQGWLHIYVCITVMIETAAITCTNCRITANRFIGNIIKQEFDTKPVSDIVSDKQVSKLLVKENSLRNNFKTVNKKGEGADCLRVGKHISEHGDLRVEIQPSNVGM